MTMEDAEGTTETAACRFWIVSWTVTRRPFQSPVALAMSSPTFLGDCAVMWLARCFVRCPTAFRRSSPDRIQSFVLLLPCRSVSRRVPPLPLSSICPRYPSLLILLLPRDTHKTQGTDLGRQSGRRSDFTTGGSEEDDLSHAISSAQFPCSLLPTHLDFCGVDLGSHFCDTNAVNTDLSILSLVWTHLQDSLVSVGEGRGHGGNYWPELKTGQCHRRHRRRRRRRWLA